MPPTRSQIITRSLTGRCPNCGAYGLFRHWFRLNRECRSCHLPLEKEEAGFYFGTTSIGYVLAIIVVIVPICFLVVNDTLGVWTGVALAIGGSILLTVILYPLLLSWVIMSYYCIFPSQLPGDSPPSPASPADGGTGSQPPG